MKHMRSTFLKEPVVETIRDGGFTAWYLRLQSGRYSRAVQPDRGLLAWFYLDAGGRPVGIKFLEPIPSPEAAVRLVQDALRRPGMDRQGLRDLVLRGIRKVAGRMPAWRPCPEPRVHAKGPV